MMQRCTLATHKGGNRATFWCPHGHVFTSYVLPKNPLGKPPSQSAINLMVSWWTKSGVNLECPTCKRNQAAMAATKE